MPDSFEQAHLRHLAELQKQLQQQYENAIQEIVVVLTQITWSGETFELKNYPLLLSRINSLVQRLHASIYTTVVNGIVTSWNLSNYKNNILVDKRLAGRFPSDKANLILYDPNREALQQFLIRKEQGLNLSDRVWNTLENYKVEQETALGVGISEGKSAAELARDMRKYLQEPDRLFRRVRADDGTLKLSRAAKNYHPGQGVMRSSFGNALRLTATETSTAYRTSDYLRWQQIPFVVGIRINTSNNHKVFDICDFLSNKNYPKDFHFKGWHPGPCLCYPTAIQLTDAEYDKYEDQILGAGTFDGKSKNTVHDVPPEFDEWVSENAERINGWKTTPWFIKDNPKYTKDLMKEKV